MAGFITGAGTEMRRGEAIGRGEAALDRPVDWLAVAVGRLGGIAPAARILGISRQSLYLWLERGLGGVAFDRVAKLSERSGIPVDLLRGRLGPWKP